MSKKLSEMSLEELWQLFPIFLTEHQDYWKDWYAEEKNFIKATITSNGEVEPYREYSHKYYLGKAHY